MPKSSVAAINNGIMPCQMTDLARKILGDFVAEKLKFAKRGIHPYAGERLVEEVASEKNFGLEPIDTIEEIADHIVACDTLEELLEWLCDVRHYYKAGEAYKELGPKYGEHGEEPTMDDWYHAINAIDGVTILYAEGIGVPHVKGKEYKRVVALLV